MPNAKPLILLCGALFAGAGGPVWAASQWYRFQAGRWEVFFEGAEKEGGKLLRNLLEAHAALRNSASELKPDQDLPALPLRFVVFRSQNDFAPFARSSRQRGLFLSGLDRGHILLWGAGQDTGRAALHELVHAMLWRVARPAPRWLEEGLADYYSTLQREGERFRAGAPPPGYLALLGSAAWLGAGRLASIRDDSGLGGDADLAALYYAESWALVRRLMEAGPGSRVARFMELLGSGQPQQAAFAQAFGLPVEEALQQAEASIRRLAGTRSAAGDYTFAAGASAGEITRRPAPEPEPQLVRAGCLLAAGLEQEAAELTGGLARKFPRDAAVLSMMGALALRRGQYGAARAAFEQAIALGDRSAATQFEFAMLVRDTGGPEALAEQSLRQAVADEPAFAEAWLVLGNWLLGRGRATEAAPCLEKAAALEPRRSVIWEAYGRALLESGARAAASQAARRAAGFAATAEQAAMAQALLREIETRPAAPRPLPAAAAPRAWQPEEGNARITGRLVHIDCETSTLRFLIELKPRTARARAEQAVVVSDQPQRIMLRGVAGGRREFVCGPQSPAPRVEAGYLASATRPEAEPAPPVSPPAATAKARARKALPKKATPRRPVPPPPPVLGQLVWLDFQPPRP